MAVLINIKQFLYRFHDKYIPLTLGICSTLFCIMILLSQDRTVQHFVQRLENLIYDFRLRQSLPFQEFKPQQVVIVDIDEASLQAEGRWPWPRDKLALLLEKLWEQNVVLVAFDVIFTEPQINIAKHFFAQGLGEYVPKERQETLIKDYDYDQRFTEAIAAGETVLGVLLHSETSEPVGALPSPLIALSDAQRNQALVLASSSYTGNLDFMQEAAVDGGFVTSIRDFDGVIRRAPLLMRYADNLYASLSLAAANSYLLTDSVDLGIHLIGDTEILEDIILDKTTAIQTTENGLVMVPFQGKAKTFRYVSATDIMNDNLIEGALDNKIILVGTSALGLADLPSTAVQGIFPGVEVHANMIEGIINNHFPKAPIWSVSVTFFQLLIIGVLFSILLVFLGPISIAASGLILLGLQIAFNILLWTKYYVVLPLFLPCALVAMQVVIALGYGFMFENRRKQQITAMFGQYVSPDIVQQMSDDPKRYSFEGKTKEMTVLFADIRSFTTISESLTAAQLKDLLNRYFEPMTEIIFDKQGTIDKYVGDMIMAFWGAPKEDANQANNAIASALNMIEHTEILKPAFAADDLPEINIGIGINTGPMNVGDMGSRYRRAYTVLGDNVNLGSRLEASTKFYGAKILIGETTFNQQTEYLCRFVDLVQVKGKQEAVKIYEPIVSYQDATPAQKEQVAQHQQAINLYLQRQWTEAKAIFQSLQKQSPEVLIYQMYQQRCDDMLASPPDGDWDGVYVRTDK